MFFIFLSSIRALCKYTVTVRDNIPLSYTYNLEETEFICINSTLPYLTVLYDPSSLIRINLYKYTNQGLQYLNTTFSPGVYGGVDFSKEVGALDIETVVSGPVSFTLFAFPRECSSLRYVTNLDSDFFTLDTKFEDFQVNTTICIWYGSLHYKFHGKFIQGNQKTTEEIKVCLNQDNCRKFNSVKGINSKSVYFTVTPRSSNFIYNYAFKFNATQIIPGRAQVADILDGNKWKELEIEESNLVQVQVKRGYLNHDINLDDDITRSIVYSLIAIIIAVIFVTAVVFVQLCKAQKQSKKYVEEALPLLQPGANVGVQQVHGYAGSGIASRYYNPPVFVPQGYNRFYPNPQQQMPGPMFNGFYPPPQPQHY